MTCHVSIFKTEAIVAMTVVYIPQIFWSENGELVCIATEESYFILKYSSEAVENAKEAKDKVTEDGIEDAFEVERSNRIIHESL